LLILVFLAVFGFFLKIEKATLFFWKEKMRFYLLMQVKWEVSFLDQENKNIFPMKKLKRLLVPIRIIERKKGNTKMWKVSVN
jgi:hypothetical protein